MVTSDSAGSSKGKRNFKKQNGDGPGSSRSASSASPRNARPTENQEHRKFDNVVYYGTVLFVDYERRFGKLAPSKRSTDPSLDGGTRNNDTVRFWVGAPGAGEQSTSTATGGMRLLIGDTLEYALQVNNPKGLATRSATLCKCKARKMDEVVAYVKNLVATAQQNPDVVLRSVTRCPAPLEYVLDYYDPSDELLNQTLVLCQILQRSRLLTEVYRSKLKQMYNLFCGSRFLLSESGFGKCCRSNGGDGSSRNLLKEFLVHLLQTIPSQLPHVLPLLMRLGECANPGSEPEDGKPIRPCEGENFLMKILNTVAGGRAGRPGSQLRAQLPLLPTIDELVKLPSRGRDSTLPVVIQKGPYSSPENYIDTYFRLLREDCFAGIIQGIQAFREGKLDDRDMKMWFRVTTVGVHFSHASSPGLTFAVRLPHVKRGGRAPKAPDSGSLVCFSDDGGSFDSPIWCVVRRCEEDVANNSCICFVDIVVQHGEQIELGSANSLSMQCARLMKGEDMAMVESPTAYYAYQPVLEALQLTDPQIIPFQDELVSVTWPYKAPDYLKSASTTLDWSCIFEPPPQGRFTGCLSFDNDSEVSASGEIREGVGGATSLLTRGYITSFDSCQLKAVELAVKNRLTIIQGPPGTGKTYIASKLLQLLLSASTFPKESPILVITFKNHALDQFLEKCLTFCTGEDSIVRVGSRSKNENLEKYNLRNKETRYDEFRFELMENMRRTREIQQNMESALRDLNKRLLSFDPLMIIAPGLQLHYFMNRLAHQDRVQIICARMLPEGFSLADVLGQDEFPEDADPGWVTDISWLKQSLVTEIKRWIPKPGVFRTVQECFSTKKPSRFRPPQRDVSAAKNATDEKAKATIVDDSDEEDDKDEQERRSAYESIRQDTKPEDLDVKSTQTFDSRSNKNVQWSQTDFMAFSKERDVHQASVAFAHLEYLDGSQFDWLPDGDPYDLSPERRAILVYKYWQRSVDAAWQRLASIKAQYDTILHDTEEISKRRKLAILRKATIIGITTTGAAMHQTVLKCLSPAVILVEEAAEILEPNVLAVLHPNLQHLIVIGDHQQLRPTVACYPLDRWHGFAVSMFERLVEHNKLPFQILSQQCRMREEFVPMLLPIYPSLKSHRALVSGSRNKAPTCMAKTMYFWAHTHEESTERSCVNPGEANMVVALARWIVSELRNPQGLKIIAAYSGQVTILQKMLEKYPELKEVEVHTIDRFQGAESEIVIVSLVRSNPVGKIGYLSDRSRLCVAASRARAGVYFVGNHSTLTEKSSHWRTLLSYFQRQEAVNVSIPLRCPRHPSQPPYALNSHAASKFEPSDVCDRRCEGVLPCGHFCASTCHSGTHSLPCKERVTFTFVSCGHSHTKLCYQDQEQELSCKTKVMHAFDNCGHIESVECWKVRGNRKLSQACTAHCGKELKCGHVCKLRCSDSCEGTPCESCAEIEREKERIRRQLYVKAVEDKQKEVQLEIQKLQEKGNEGILVHKMDRHGDTAEAYFLAKERVEKLYSIQPDCKTALEVTEVEKIENLQLQRKFLESQRELINPLEIPKWLFYGGPDDLLDQVVNKGFDKTPRKQGHSFDVYSSTIAKERHGKLLLCEVHLGRTWRYPSDKDSINLSKLRDHGYDSLTLAADEDIEWESKQAYKHVIVNPEQAIPRFIVSYKLVDFRGSAIADEIENFGEQQALTTNGVCRLPLMPSSNFQGATPQEIHFQRVESIFLSKFEYSSIKSKVKVTKVEVVINLALKQKYLEKKEEFEKNKIAVTERWVFHGTYPGAIDKIATQGFKIGGTEGVAIGVGAVYGHGVYTAVNPDISVPYCRGSQMMLLSLAVPGVRHEHHSFGENENVLLFKDVSQLLPRYVVHYT